MNQLDTADPDANFFSDNIVNFSTYSLDSLRQSKIDKNSLNIFHHNSRSILTQGRKDLYDHLLDVIDNPFQIMAFTETWLRKDNVNIVQFDGFDHVSLLRPPDREFNLKERGGGLSFFIKEGINYKSRDDLNLMLPHIETLFIELNLNDKKYMIGVIYRVPNTNIRDFIDSLNSVIEPIRREYELIIVGDYNICMMQDNEYTQSFRNSLQTHNLFPSILEPTRVASVNRNGTNIVTQTLIDNIFLNTSMNFRSGLVHTSISDHYPIFVSISQSISEPYNPVFVKYRNIDSVSLRKFKYALNNSVINSVYEVSDAKLAFELFLKTFSELYEKFFPVKTKSVSHKSTIKPWVTTILAKRIKIKDKLGILANKGRIDQNVYKDFRNVLTKQLRKAKAEFYDKEFNESNGNIKKTWEIINKTIKKKSFTNNINIIENEQIVKSSDVPNQFSKFFANIAEKLVSQIPATNANSASYLRNRISNSFFMPSINYNEIDNAIKELKDNGCGLYKFATTVINESILTINKPLAYIFDLCISQGYFPTELKLGCITPVHKKDDKTDINNYRPVCSLSPFSKIFEKIIHNKMINFLDKFNILSDTQYGFRKNMSTETTLLKFIDFIHNGLNKKENVGAIYMDLSKAFDVMNHKILEHKLEHYGFRGSFLKFIMSFLKDRQYFVNANGINSDIETLNIGVPQGSTLGPLLFLIYINDMKNSSILLKFLQFADDTTLLFSCKDFNHLKLVLESESEKVIDWLSANKLIINLKKTCSMLFSFKRGNPSLELNVKNVLLENKNEVKFLGVNIDNKLNWKSHISLIRSKISKSIAILKLLKFIYPTKILRTIYMSLIYSHLNYCNLIWGGAENTNLEPLFKLQKKAVRIINNSHYLDHTPPIFKSLKILNVFKIYILNCSLFIFKCLKCNKFPFFRSKIVQNLNLHNYNTRNRTMYRSQENIRLRICQRSFFHKSISVWNSLDNDIKEINTMIRFKRTMKDHLINY